MALSEEIKELILKKASSSQIKKKAREMGMATLFESGIEKIKLGMTTVEEVMRVTELND